MVSQQLLIELQKIIEEEYGQDLGKEKISQIGNGLVGYFDLLAKMHHENNQNNKNAYEKIYSGRNCGKS